VTGRDTALAVIPNLIWNPENKYNVTVIPNLIWNPEELDTALFCAVIPMKIGIQKKGEHA